MNKKIKLYIIVGITFTMLLSWAALFFTNTQEQQINYWWQVAMGASAIIFAALGISTAAKWGWLKSGVGRGVFFISLALLMWGIGQLGWSYFLFADPGTEAPQSHLLDIIDFLAIPLWFVGIIMLSKATGARYGLRKLNGKILVFLLAVIMIFLSVYFLVEVARGGSAYFDQTFWKAFFDLGYSIGDAVIATIAIAVFALSWKVLGGRFKLPITIILSAFVLLYFADFSFSYLDGRGEYYNGNITDLIFMLTIAAFGLGTSMLDPTHVRKNKAKTSMSQPVATTPPVTLQSKASEPTVPDFVANNPTAPYAQPHDNSEQKESN